MKLGTVEESSFSPPNKELLNFVHVDVLLTVFLFPRTETTGEGAGRAAAAAFTAQLACSVVVERRDAGREPCPPCTPLGSEDMAKRASARPEHHQPHLQP